MYIHAPFRSFLLLIYMNINRYQLDYYIERRQTINKPDNKFRRDPCTKSRYSRVSQSGRGTAFADQNGGTGRFRTGPDVKTKLSAAYFLLGVRLPPSSSFWDRTTGLLRLVLFFFLLSREQAALVRFSRTAARK